MSLQATYVLVEASSETVVDSGLLDASGLDPAWDCWRLVADVQRRGCFTVIWCPPIDPPARDTAWADVPGGFSYRSMVAE